jgi:hypothetical protein
LAGFHLESAQGLSDPVLTAVAGTLLKHRKQYYGALERLSALRRVATIESVGSSTRIEGSRHDRDGGLA